MVNPLARVVTCVFLVVLGFATGVVSVLTHAVIVSVGGGHWPVGIVVAVGGSGGLFVLGAQVLASRLGAVLPLSGWLIAVLILANTTSSGSQVLPAEPLGQAVLSYVLLFGGAAAGMVAATMPTRRAPRPPRPPRPAATRPAEPKPSERA